MSAHGKFGARLWLTLRTLLAAPGKLTLEYFANGRAQRVPPLQLYLLVSLIFFGLLRLSAHWYPKTADNGIGVDIPFDAADCQMIDLDSPWLARHVREACKRLVADGGQSTLRSLSSDVPKMMFIFLPLLAAVMMALYAGTGRRYREHLVYFAHVHAAFYVALAAGLLVEIAARFFPWLQLPSVILDNVVAIYASWYLYRSMRQYYGEARGRTLTKLTLISLAYTAFLALMWLGTLLFGVPA